jgi:hypothetical protein
MRVRGVGEPADIRAQDCAPRWGVCGALVCSRAAAGPEEAGLFRSPGFSLLCGVRVPA